MAETDRNLHLHFGEISNDGFEITIDGTVGDLTGECMGILLAHTEQVGGEIETRAKRSKTVGMGGVAWNSSWNPTGPATTPYYRPKGGTA